MVTLHEVITFLFFNDTTTTEIYTLTLHDALPICIAARAAPQRQRANGVGRGRMAALPGGAVAAQGPQLDGPPGEDRKSTRLNSSHLVISYAVFCLKTIHEVITFFVSMQISISSIQ